MSRNYYPRLRSIFGICALALTTQFLLVGDAVQAQPTITSVTPASGIPLLTPVTITGTGFNATPANNKVHFGADTAVITGGSTTTLSMLVPIGAQYTTINVMNRITRLAANSDLPFLPEFTSSCFVPNSMNFKPKVDISTSTGIAPMIPTVGDIDGDGKPDIVTANYTSNNISILRNTGVPGAGGLTTASFAAAVSYGSAMTTAQSVKLADLDGDGKLDYVVASIGGGGRLNVVRNTSVPGTITNGPTRTYITGTTTLGGKASEAAVADFDGDGKPDIAVVVDALDGSGNYSGLDSVKVFKNNILAVPTPLATAGFIGTSFTGPISFSNGFASTPVSLFVIDFDGDGKPDIVTANQYNYGTAGQGSICLYKNTSTGAGVISFSAPIEFALPTSLQPNQVIAADINGDNKPDIIVSSTDILGSTNSKISVFQNNISAGAYSASSLGTRVDFSVGGTSSFPLGICAGDLDGDGKVDIAVGTLNDAMLTIFRNNSGGTINTASLVSTVSYLTGISGGQPIGVSIGDMDGDTKPDILVANKAVNSISIFRNYPIPSSDTISGNTHLCIPTVSSFSNTIGGGIWSVTNTALATINSVTGATTPVSAGTDTVVYTIICNGDTTVVSKPFTVTALPVVAPITGTTTTLCTGTSLTLNDVTPLGTWLSTQPGFATVSGGVVGGGTAGTVTISYYLTNSCGTTASTYGPITVTTSPQPITGNFAICTGGTTSLLDASAPAGTWSTSAPPTVATITSTGMVTGVSAGNAMISYSIGTCFDTAIVSIGFTPTVNPITGTTTTLCTGSQTTLNETATGGSWTSSDNTLATVTSGGVVTAVAAGTVYITYTIVGLCSSPHQVYGPITVYTSPAAITGTMSVCVGATTTLFNSVSPGVWSSATSTAATVTSGGVVGGANGGNEVISYTMAGGCYKTATVTVNPYPTVAAITGPISVCKGTTISLNETTTGGSWSSSNNLIATVTSGGIVTGVNVGNDTITYSKTNGCGTSKQIQIVTVNPNPAAITGATFTVCEGATISLFDTFPGGTWSTAPASTATITTNGAVGGAAAGVATISYVVTGGCFDTALVTVIPSPVPITGGNSLCLGNSITLIDLSGNGTWSTSAPTFATVNSTTGMVTGLLAGSANITFTFTSNSCATSIPFTVLPLPNAIGGPTHVCLGLSDTVTDTSPLGTWSTTTPGIATIDANTGKVTGLAVGNALITYTITSTGCSISSVQTVNSLPGAIAGPSSVCLGYFATLTDTPSGGHWFSTNSTSAPISPSGIVAGAILGTTTISYTILSTGCYATKNVTVNPLPQPITGLQTICSGTDITLHDATGLGNWSVANPALATVVNNSTGEIKGLAGGVAMISYTLAATGCFDTALLHINPSPAPITGASSVCLGSSTPLSSDSTGGIWTSTDTMIAKIDSFTGNVIGRAPGIVTITYSAGVFGCSATMSFTVNPITTPAVSVSVSPSTTVCAGTLVTFTANPVNPGPTPAYQWYINHNAAPISGSSSFAYVPSNNDSIRVVFSSSASCPVPAVLRDTVAMIVNPLLTPHLHLTTPIGDTVCQGVPVTINPNVTNAGVAPTFQWKVNYIPVGPGSTFTYVPANGDIVTVIVHSNATCILVDTATDTLHLTVSPFVTPTVSLIGSDSTCGGYPTVFYTSQTNGGWSPTYAWTIDGNPAGTGSSIAFSGVTGNVVQVTMTSHFPCLLTPTAISAPHTITVVPVALPALTLSVHPGYIVTPGTPVTFVANVTNPGASPTYKWKHNGVIIPGASNTTYTTSSISNNDNFACYLTNNDFCNGISVFGTATIQIGANVGITQVNAGDGNISIAPNPNNGSFIIMGSIGVNSNEDIAIEVTNMLGQIVYRGKANATNGAVEEQVLLGSSLSSGMYLLHIHSEHFYKTIHFELGK